MPTSTVPVVMTDLSVTESDNHPPDSWTITATTRPSDVMRNLGAIIRREQAQGVAVASAATTNIGATTDGAYIHISGVTTITSFGTVAAGIERTVVFDGILTLTHNASIILPGGASITTAAGDVAVFRSEGSGVWRCVSYTASAAASSYQPLDAQLTTLAGITAQQATDLAAVSTFMGTVLNDVDAATARGTLGVTTLLDLKSPLASPTFTGIPTAPTAATTTNTTQLATTAFVQQEIAAGVGGMTLLGTLATTSGATATLSALTLTNYKMLLCMLNGVSHDNASTNIRLNGLVISANGDNTKLFTGAVWVDLVSGKFNSTVCQEGDADFSKAGDTAYDTSSTSIQFTVGAGAFDAGSIRIWGVK